MSYSTESLLRSDNEPDADQDGCRNRCLFRTEVESQDIRNTKYTTAGKIVNQKHNQNQES